MLSPEEREFDRRPSHHHLRRRPSSVPCDSWWLVCSTCCSRCGGSVAPSRGVFVLFVLCAVMHRLCLASCPQGCDCKWKYGKETVDCSGAGFIDVPPTFDPGTQMLDMSHNNLQVLPKDTFVNAGLLNLQRIHLQHCHLKQIDQEAFRRLSNLVELDISHNEMTYVPAAAFGEMPALRRLIFNDNPLKQLDDDAFAHLPSLTALELSRCQIDRVGNNAFRGLDKLTFLKLDGNELVNIPVTAMTSLRSLHGIDLHDNPWHCDCHLRPARQWVLKTNVPVSVIPACATPTRLANVTWDKLSLEEFACETRITVVHSPITVNELENVTLWCRVSGNPEPAVHWVRKGRVIANLSSITRDGAKLQEPDQQPIYIIHEDGVLDKVSNLTITTAMTQDTGSYTCVAENKANRKMNNVTLVVIGKTSNTPSTFTSIQFSGMVGGGAVGFVVLIVLALALAFKYRRRRRERKRVLAEHKHHHVCLLNHKEAALVTLDKQRLSSLMAKAAASSPPPRIGVHYQEIPTVDKYETIDKNFIGQPTKLSTVAEEPAVSEERTKVDNDNTSNEESESILDQDEITTDKEQEQSERSVRTPSSLPESCASCGQPLPPGKSTLDRPKSTTESDQSRTCVSASPKGEKLITGAKLSTFPNDGTRV